MIEAAYAIGLLGCLAWAQGHNIGAAGLAAAAALTALLAEHFENRGR
jgi:hypothetical protein